MLDPLLAELLRAALSLLFGVALWHKLRGTVEFRETLRNYRLLPDGLVAPATLGVLGAEAFVAVGLWLPASQRVAATVGAGLLLLYSLAIGLNLWRGRREIDCGCLGPAAGASLSASLLVRNALLCGGALALLLPAAARSLHPLDALSFAGGLATLVLLFHALNQLAAIAARSTRRSLS